MKRTIAALRPVWDKLLLLLGLVVIVDVLTAVVPGLPEVGLPGGFMGVVAVIVGFVALMVLIGVAPRNDALGPVDLAPPVRGTWVSMNGPGQQLPSHGTRTRGQYGAIDVAGVSSATTPRLVRFARRSSRPEEFPWFGEPIVSMAAGTVVRVRDGQRDHRARNTWQGLAYMMLVEGLVREMAGSSRILGNHVVVDHGDGTFAVYAHVRRGSATVAEGARVDVGQQLGEIGNTGNTSMPHLHVQLMDRASVDAAAGVVMRWPGLALTGELDAQMAPFAKEPADSAVAGMPRNAEIFTA